jgi:hypothetical protein
LFSKVISPRALIIKTTIQTKNHILISLSGQHRNKVWILVSKVEDHGQEQGLNHELLTLMMKVEISSLHLVQNKSNHIKKWEIVNNKKHRLPFSRQCCWDKMTIIVNNPSTLAIRAKLEWWRMTINYQQCKTNAWIRIVDIIQVPRFHPK